MARISTYAIDGQPVSSDKLIGTDSSGTTTKNYPLGSVSDWLKESGASAVLGQNNYSFQIALDPDAGRLPGSFSFENYGGDGTEFLDISRLMVSKSSSTGKYVGDYLLSIVGDRVMLGQLDDLNSFGVYTLVSLVQSPIEPTFYDAELLFVEGNGALLGNKLYGLATYSASASAESAVWGSIEGTVTNQTDLVNYIDAEIAAIPVPATPTLQTVTDEGNTTSNLIGIGATTGLFYPLTIEPNGTSNYIELRGSSNAGLYAVGKGLLAFDTSKNFIVYTGGINERMRVTSAGNVGIGTTAPTEKLEVDGNIKIHRHGADDIAELKLEADRSFGRTITLGTTGAAPYIKSDHNLSVTAYSGTAPDTQIYLSGGGADDHIRFNTNQTERARITNTGLGIGTTAPTRNLEIAAQDGAYLRLSSANTNTSTGALIGSLEYKSSDSDSPRVVSSINSIIKDVYGRSADLIFSTAQTNQNNAERMRITDTGNVGIGTTVPSALLEIASNSTNDFIKLTTTGGGATPVKLIFEKTAVEQGIIEYNRNGNLEIYNTDNDGGVLISGSGSANADMYVNHAGNVGIGTTAPQQKLHVDGTIRIGSDVDLSRYAGSLRTAQNLVLGSLNLEGANLTINAGSTQNAIGVRRPPSGTTSILKVRDYSTQDVYVDIDSDGNAYFDGNVGIGTTGPAEKLQVSSGNILLDTNTWIGSGSGSGQPRLRFDNTNSQGKLQQADLVLNDEKSVAWSNTGTSIQGRGTDNQRIEFNVASSERMRITSNGRVGIGTTAPSEILQVGNDSVSGNYIQIAKKDNSHAGIKISETSAGRIGFLRVNQSEDLEIGTELNNDVDIFTNGVSRVTIEGDNGATQGYVGIRTTTPESELTVNGYIQVPNGRGITFSDIGDGNANRVSIVGSEDSDTMFFKTDNSVRMAFASGNVGIGTTSPDVKLQVVGQAQELGNSFNGLLYLKGTNALASYDTANKIVISSNGSSDGLYPGGLHFTRRNFAQQGNYGSGIRGISVGTVLQDNALELYTSTNTERNATRLKITSTGNVGIGTTAPAYKLQVGGTINADKIFIDNTTDGHQIGKLIIDYQAAQNPALNSAGGDYIRFNNSILLGGNGDNIKASSTKSDDLYFQHQRTGNVGFRFTTADSGSVLRIAGSGNVGIGTTAPDSKVHISGTAMQQLRMETAGGPSSAGDTNGRIGDMAYDDDFFYIKTANGWGRVQLDFGF